jgi:predicted TIM-barrel fold metal-dependent hydrolase
MPEMGTSGICGSPGLCQPPWATRLTQITFYYRSHFPVSFNFNGIRLTKKSSFIAYLFALFASVPAERFARIIRQTVDSFGPERVLYGTDAPFTWQSLPEIDFVTAITNLTTMAPDDAKLTESEVEMILGMNAKKLLNI